MYLMAAALAPMWEDRETRLSWGARRQPWPPAHSPGRTDWRVQAPPPPPMSRWDTSSLCEGSVTARSDELGQGSDPTVPVLEWRGLAARSSVAGVAPDHPCPPCAICSPPKPPPLGQPISSIRKPPHPISPTSRTE